MTENLADLILSTSDLGDVKAIDVKQWPATAGKLFVRQMNAKERDIYYHLIRQTSDGKPSDIMTRVAAMVLVDKDGKRIFTDEQADKLGAKNPEAIEHIYVEWQQLQTPVSDDEQKKS